MIDALWGWPPPILDPAGPYAEPVTTLAWVLFAMGVLVTAIVVAALYVALRGSEAAKVRLGGERTIWIGGVAFPAVVLTALLVWGLTLTASLTEDIDGNEMRIRVTGEMWWYRVDYLRPDGSILFTDANEVHFPADTPVVFELESADVIHGFWVPHLSGKLDMIPGRTNFLRVEADEVGTYGGLCTEFCGRQHALMGFVAVVHDEEDWIQWRDRRLRANARAVATSAGSSRGEALFMESGCAACHRVAGTQAEGIAGPDLTHMGSRATLAAGILPNNRGTLMGWIGDSQSIKPGNRMPSYDRLSARELEDIAIWLEQQK